MKGLCKLIFDMVNPVAQKVRRSCFVSVLQIISLVVLITSLVLDACTSHAQSSLAADGGPDSCSEEISDR